MRMTIYIGGAAAMFVCLSLILAVPDFGAVISGAGRRPRRDVLWRRLRHRSGPGSCSVVVLISFVSCALSLQAAASRLIYSYARDGMLPFSGCAQLRETPPRPAVRPAGRRACSRP